MVRTMLQRPSGAIETPADIAAAVKDLLRSIGERATCADLLISRNTASKMAAGLSVRRGSIAIVRERLAELAIPVGGKVP